MEQVGTTIRSAVKQDEDRAQTLERKVRVAHLVSHPIQYYVPLYRLLDKRPDIDLTVYFTSAGNVNNSVDIEFGRKVEWDIPLLGGYKHVFCGGAEKRPSSYKKDLRPNWSILSRIVRGKYDAIWVNGYASTNAWLALLAGNLLGIPVLLRDEQNFLTPRSPRNKLIRRLILPVFYKHVYGLFIGRSSRDHFLGYGTPEEKLFPAYYSVDNSFFQERYAELTPRRAECRAQYGITDGAPVILFCGKLIGKKAPQFLLEAFRQVRAQTKCHLLIAGDGPLRSSLQEFASLNNIQDIHWAGFINQTKLPSAYIAADLLALTSTHHETWGLVVNEAMNFGLPVVVSDRVGCAADLVRNGVNGYVFEAGNIQSLVASLLNLVQSPTKLSGFGKASTEIITDYSAERSAEQIASACVQAAKR